MTFFLHFYDWLESKLNRKYILGMASGLVAISLLFAVLFINMYQEQLAHERANTSLHLNKLLQTALEHAMLKRDLDGLRSIISSFGQQQGVKNVMILNIAGQVRFAAKKQYLGQIFEGIGESIKHQTRFIKIPYTGEVLRSINPIFNRDECHQCHGPKQEHPINGVIVVDFDASTLRKNARNTTLMLMGAGSTVVLITLLGGWWFMGKFVLKPVHRLLKAQEKFVSGDLKTRVRLPGKDEISMLGNSFDSMAETIETQWNKLEKSKDFLQSLIEGIPDGVRVLDQNYNILIANHAYVEHTGYPREKALSLKCYNLHMRNEPCIPTLETCPLFEINSNAKSIKTIHNHINAYGEENLVEIFAAPVATESSWGKSPIIIEVIRDLSESVNYSQEQRLTSLGMLASGVAHEIHNPLGSIQIAFHSIDQLIETDEPVLEQLKYYIKLIEGEIDKCVNITGRLLKLGNLPDKHLQPINLNIVISETLSLLQWEADSKNIEMCIDIHEASSLRVLATDNEMRMMILNLIQNAYHAMPDGGKLLVSAKRDNGYAIIIIEDTGVGIPSEIQARIFDPFFSNRSDQASGTGLGLSIVKAIIKRFNGDIEVSSQVGKGTIFTITLPNADGKLDNNI